MITIFSILLIVFTLLAVIASIGVVLSPLSNRGKKQRDILMVKLYNEKESFRQEWKNRVYNVN